LSKNTSLETRSKMAASAKKRWEDPSQREQQSQATKTYLSNPINRKAQGESIRNGQNNPKTKEKMSKSAKARWDTPEKRLQNINAIKKGLAKPETKLLLSNIMSNACGKNGRNWQGGISFKTYCPKFNEDLKRRIRAFFNYECVTCGKTTAENIRQLCCHHIEYNKDACCDGTPIQFAALCMKCHVKTNADRQRWESMLHRIIDEIYQGKSYYTKDEWAALNQP